MDSVNIKNFNTLKTMEKIFSIPPGPKHIVEAANYLYGTENEFGSKINETSAYNYFSGMSCAQPTYSPTQKSGNYT